MYESKVLKSMCSMPMMQLRLLDNRESEKSAGYWLPLKQDWSTRWCTLPERYMDGWIDRISNFETRESDVYVVTYMKAGTTWMQELSWLLLNNLNFTSAANEHSIQRCPFLEFSVLRPEIVKDSVKNADDQANPRVIKSHLPTQFLPRQIFEKSRKIIYVARNPKDLIVSAYHFAIGIDLWQGDLNTFVNEFTSDKFFYCSFWSHVVDFWRIRNNPNIFFVTYEEMKRDLKEVIERLCRFLDIRELKGWEMKQLLEYLSFENMKEKKFINPTGHMKNTRTDVSVDFEFMRRGIVGSYKDELTSDQREKIDNWSNEYLKPYGIRESDIFSKV